MYGICVSNGGFAVFLAPRTDWLTSDKDGEQSTALNFGAICYDGIKRSITFFRPVYDEFKTALKTA